MSTSEEENKSLAISLPEIEVYLLENFDFEPQFDVDVEQTRITFSMQTNDVEPIHNSMFRCDLCGIFLKEQRYLEAHTNEVHLNVKPYSCPYCSVGYFLRHLFCQLCLIKYHIFTPFSITHYVLNV